MWAHGNREFLYFEQGFDQLSVELVVSQLIYVDRVSRFCLFDWLHRIFWQHPVGGFFLECVEHHVEPCFPGTHELTQAFEDPTFSKSQVEIGHER